MNVKLFNVRCVFVSCFCLRSTLHQGKDRVSWWNFLREIWTSFFVKWFKWLILCKLINIYEDVKFRTIEHGLKFELKSDQIFARFLCFYVYLHFVFIIPEWYWDLRGPRERGARVTPTYFHATFHENANGILKNIPFNKSWYLLLFIFCWFICISVCIKGI